MSGGAGDGAILDGNGASSAKENGAVVGGAFYDLASQCLTPLIGGRGSVGLSSNSVKGRRAGSSAPPVRWRLEGEQQMKSSCAVDVVDTRVELC